MKHDFETMVDRSGQGSRKWKQMYEWNPDVEPGIIPFSVADMEFKHPQALIDGMKNYLDTAVLGYNNATDSYFNAVKGWFRRRHGWEVKEDWFVYTPGVVFAFYEAIKAFTRPGEGVLTLTPVYHLFHNAITKTGRKRVDCPLVPDENHVYHIDFEDFEAKAKDPSVKLFIMCSPHNPVSRVWTKEELTRLGRICMDHGVRIVADEIHCDFVMPGHEHTMFASISQEFADNCIVCTAPSKSFNLAGIQCSNIFIPNEELRNQYIADLPNYGSGSRLNTMAYVACELAYNQCEDWFDQLLVHIRDCADSITDFCNKYLPRVKVTPLEGTYLLWMDFSDYGFTGEELERIMHMEAQFFADEGYIFGESCTGFERVNLAAPKKALMEGMERVRVALEKYE